MAIVEVRGDLFKSKMQTIAITVNVVGAMGKGVARTCRELYPECLSFYLKHYSYSTNSNVPYQVHLERSVRTIRIFDCIEGDRRLLFFPTKQHWKMPSKLEWIEENLLTVADHYQSLGITSLALPPLGCGNGGLNTADVFPRIKAILRDIDIPVELYVGP